jgi:hypothetical protein
MDSSVYKQVQKHLESFAIVSAPATELRPIAEIDIDCTSVIGS